MHPAIVDADLFAAVEARLDANARRQDAKLNRVQSAPLTGRIFDADGHPMSPTFSRGASGKLYRYYVSAPLQQGVRPSPPSHAIRRVPASGLEALVTRILTRLTPDQHVLAQLKRVEIHEESLHLLLPVKLLAAVRSRIGEGESIARDSEHADLARLEITIKMRLRGGRTIIISSGKQPPRRDPVLVRALRAAHAMVGNRAGMPQLDAAPASPYLRKLVRLAFLAPDIQEAILAGRQPQGLVLEQLLHGEVPTGWAEQRRLLGMR